MFRNVMLFHVHNGVSMNKEQVTMRFIYVQYMLLLLTKFKVRGGPLDILGGGVSDPKKKFMQEIELEKKIPACA